MGYRPHRSSSRFLENWAALYTKPTASENAIEPAISALGIPYRAQHPVFAAHCIVDFALLGPRIAIEVDGKSHNGPAAKANDRTRTLKLEALGWVVVRCSNEQAQLDPVNTVQRMLLEARDRREALAILAYATHRDRNSNA